MARSDALQSFLDTAFVSFDQFAQDLRARRSIMQIFAHLNAPHPENWGVGKRLPVCTRYLGNVLAAKTGQSSLDLLIERFKAVEPFLEWKTRAIYDKSASNNFLLGHANTMIVGPGGLEHRSDV